MKHPWLDDSQRPLLKVTYPYNFTMDDLTRMFAEVEAFYASNTEPFAWIVDVSKAPLASSEGRKITTAHERRSAEHVEQFNRGTAFVITSRTIRGVLTAIYWVAPPVYPYKVFSELAAAERWARGQLGGERKAVS